MKAVVYKGVKSVAVEEIEMARIEEKTDALLKITSAAICGSDLHMYDGRTPFEVGRSIGHEIMGVIEKVGDAVTQIKVGGPGRPAVQHRLRRLLQLQPDLQQCLPGRQPGRRWGRLRLFRPGAVSGRAG